MMNKKLKLISSSLLACLFIGCVSSRKNAQDSGQLGVGQSLQSGGQATNETVLKEVPSFRVSDPEGPKVVDQELEQIPVEINSSVEKWINYFQGRGRPHMERYLSRSTRYMKLMKKILRDNGLPEDLVYIALIESGFNWKATSKAAAVGYWQFIKGTGRRYGMEINTLVDERRDPVLSTQAAAEYFKGLYSVFGSWYLAMASYNVGENRVKKEVMKNMTRDFWVLAQRKRLPKETINYIPKFIAAKLIGNDPAKYGFTDVDYMDPIEFEHIKVDRPVNLKLMAEKMGVDYDDLKLINPKFKGEIAPVKGNGTLELRVPVGTMEKGLVAANEASVDRVEYIADAGETDLYKVRSGDSLYTIARKYRTTVAWLRDTNDMKKGRKLKIGQRLIVPDRNSKPTVVKYVAKKTETKPLDVEKTNSKPEDGSVASEAAVARPEVVTAKGVFYIVQPGDTLSEIADDYNSSIDELRKMNKMSKGTVLKAGMKIRVPKDETLPTEPSGSRFQQDSINIVKKMDAAEDKLESKIENKIANSRDPQAITSTHVVRPGENLTTISKKYGVSIQFLRKVNNLEKRSVLKVGATLVIPTERPQSNFRGQKNIRKKMAKVHIVKKGENLTLIADKYRVDLLDLKEKNSHIRGSKLFVGSRIIIPLANASQ